MLLVMPPIVPVKVGLASGAFESSPPCVAFDFRLRRSAMLSTLDQQLTW